MQELSPSTYSKAHQKREVVETLIPEHNSVQECLEGQDTVAAQARRPRLQPQAPDAPLAYQRYHRSFSTAIQFALPHH